MPIPFVFNSIVYAPSPIVLGLPRPRNYDPLPNGHASDKFAGRKVDAYAKAFHLMKTQARTFLFAPSAVSLVQRLVVTFGDETCLTLEQILCGWPIPPEGLWDKKLGKPEYAPVKRVRSVPDVNGVASPMPLRLFIRAAGTNKQRLWRLDADGMPPAYFLPCPDGARHFIHAAYLGQLILSSCPNALHEILGLA